MGGIEIRTGLFIAIGIAYDDNEFMLLIPFFVFAYDFGGSGFKFINHWKKKQY